MRIAVFSLALAVAAAGAAMADSLRTPADFQSIHDRAARSAAIFGEIGKVIESPRCMNCHPAGDRPTQGDDFHPHNPPVVRGAADFGAPGLQCTTCHGPKNTPIVTSSIRSVPGNPAWRLAPAEMGWTGKTLRDICVQIKDPKRNGGRDLEKIYAHMASDDLVGWGWAPGDGRAPAPGTQKALGDLVRAWIDTGAACPG